MKYNFSTKVLPIQPTRQLKIDESIFLYDERKKYSIKAIHQHNVSDKINPEFF